MGITRRRFIKSLGGVMTALTLSEAPSARAERAGIVRDAKTRGAKITHSICPFCGVGCGILAHTRDGKLVHVDGDPDHPINQGTLCSKGQALFEVVTSPRRLKKVLYRAPGSDRWEERDLDWAITSLAERIKATRDSGFVARSSSGVSVNRAETLACIGGAALNNEECYLMAKLARALGIVYLEHQGRL